MEKNFEKVMRQVAAQNGTTIEEAIAEMQAAIDESWANPCENCNRMHKDFSGKPTPEQFIRTILGSVALELAATKVTS